MNGQFGLYSGLSPKKIANNVFQLCMNDSLSEFMSMNARALSYPRATQDIARDLGIITFRETPEIPDINLYS